MGRGSRLCCSPQDLPLPLLAVQAPVLEEDENLDVSYRNRHVLGMITFDRRLKPLVYWRYAFMQAIQHKFTILVYLRELTRMKDLSGLPDVLLLVLTFLVRPFQQHKLLRHDIVLAKIKALKRVTTAFWFVKHQ